MRKHIKKILIVSFGIILIISLILFIKHESSKCEALELKLTQAALNTISIQNAFVDNTIAVVATNKDFTIGKIDLISLEQIFNMENPFPLEYNRFTVEIVARVINGIVSSQSLEERGHYFEILVALKDELTDIETQLDFLATGDESFSKGSGQFVAFREAHHYRFLVDEHSREYKAFDNYMRALYEKYSILLNF